MTPLLCNNINVFNKYIAYIGYTFYEECRVLNATEVPAPSPATNISPGTII